jgi:hypothetical protein
LIHDDWDGLGCLMLSAKTESMIKVSRLEIDHKRFDLILLWVGNLEIIPQTSAHEWSTIADCPKGDEIQ